MTAERSIARIVIAGAASNVGKTTITAGIIAALCRRGLIVQPFKCGPDYIDPSYHARAAKRPCRNLDTWMLTDEQLLQGFARACRDADVAVIEGVMGLFDGSNWDDDRGSTAQIAKLLGAPVLLVVDISGAARSAAVTVLGCRQFDPDVQLAGAVLNFAGSENHAAGCAASITQNTGLPVLGSLLRKQGLKIPERHLGLVPGTEQEDVAALIDSIEREVAQRFDVAQILKVAQSARGVPPAADAAPTPRPTQRGPRPIVAVARDAAFCFYYPENLELLEEAGARVEFFEPLRGQAPCAGAAGVYLGGGYPELHGRALSANAGLWHALRDLHAADAPIYAECGGFMVLMQELIDAEHRRWPMAALIPGVARMSAKLAALGYRHATPLRPNLISRQLQPLRGHEFRYSHWECDTPVADDAAWQVSSGRGVAAADSVGFARGNLLGSYLHVHFAQSPDIAVRFVEKMTAR